MNILDRKVAPKFNPIGSVDFIPPIKKELDNKVPVHIISGGSQEILKIDFIFQAGIWHQKSPLIARATNSLIKEGTKKYSSAEIANGIDQYGAYLQTECDYDRASITVFTLSKYLEKILPFIKEILTQPTFDTKEFDIYKQNAFQKHKINLEKVSYIARNEFMKQLFGDKNSYGRIASEKDFQSLNNNDIIEHYNSFYNLGNCEIIVSGNVNDIVLSTLNRSLGDIKTNPVSIEHLNSEIPNLKPQKIYKEKEKALQSAIRIGKLMPTKTHPDYFKLQILNTVLGGYFGSRLMKNIREDKGYTYGIGSGILSLQNAGYFYISTEVGANVTTKALDEIYKELKKLNSELIPQGELNLVKNYLLGNFLKACDGPFKMAALFENVHFYGFDFDFYNRYIYAIKNVTSNELQEVANKYLTIESLTEIVAGKKD